MNKYGVCVDSTVYLPKDFIKENNIEVVSLNIEIDEVTHLEKDISREFIIEERSKGKSFKTSAPGPGRFLETYEQMLETYEHVFMIGLSRELSGTYQSSVLGRNMLYDKSLVTVFDTLQSAYGNEMLVYKLLEMIEDGKDVAYITKRMNMLIENATLMFTCENLFSLVAGGRLSSAKAMIGTVLRIKPVIEMIDGKLILIKSERTYNKLFQLIKERITDTTKGYKKLYVYITNTYSPKSGASLKTFIESNFPDAEITYTDLLGPVMTVHVGNKGFGISWCYE